MRMSTVRRWRIAAVTSFFGLGLVHCTFVNLNGLGSGSPDAAVPQESGGEALPDVASSDDSDAATGDSGDSRDTGTAGDAGDAGAHDADASPNVADSGAPDGTGSGADAADAAPDGTLEPACDLPIWHDAGAPSWCTMYGFGSTFCADFDEGPLPATFNLSDGDFLYETSSSAELDSLSNDLLFWTPAQTTLGPFGSKLARQFETYTSSIVLSFDIMPLYVNSTTGILFAGLDFLGKAAPAAYSLRLAYNEGQPRVEESFLGSPADNYFPYFALPVGVWSRVQVNVTFANADGGGADAGSSSVVVSVGGVVQGLPQTLNPPPGFDSRPNLLIGAVYFVGPTNSWSFRYDNVLLTLQ